MTQCSYCQSSGIGVCTTEARSLTCKNSTHPSAARVQVKLDAALRLLRSIKRRPGVPVRVVRDVSETLRALTGRAG